MWSRRNIWVSITLLRIRLSLYWKLAKGHLHKLCMFLNNITLIIEVINYLTIFGNNTALILSLRHFLTSTFQLVVNTELIKKITKKEKMKKIRIHNSNHTYDRYMAIARNRWLPWSRPGVWVSVILSFSWQFAKYLHKFSIFLCF